MSGSKQVLIIDDVHELLIKGLKQHGWLVHYRPEWGRDDLISHLEQMEGLVVRTKTNIDQHVLSHAKKLKWIARAGAGLDNIDTAYCNQHQIAFFNAGEANADAVGEQTMAMLLSLLANIVKADAEVREGIWDRLGNTGEELSGKTVGIIGYGNTGKAVARRLAGFNVKVLAYDKYLQHYTDSFATESTMQDIFENADVLSLHVPLTAETKNMVDDAFIRQFKKPIILLNLSRGKIVRLQHLCEAMESGLVKKAALDVLENENLNALTAEEKDWYNKLIRSNKVILTPHIGGWTVESYRKISEVLLQKIKELTG
jgi:D-3-phosphoglycerate dehydrogenase